MNNEIKNKIMLELMIKEFVTAEETPAATELKVKLIKELIDNEISYINVFHYYYTILKLNED